MTYTARPFRDRRGTGYNTGVGNIDRAVPAGEGSEAKHRDYRPTTTAYSGRQTKFRETRNLGIQRFQDRGIRRDRGSHFELR
jgi:hypothetical protein